MEHETTPPSNHNNICRDDQLHYSQIAQDTWATVPKRKPVPPATAANNAETAKAVTTDEKHLRSNAHLEKRALPILGFGGLRFKSARRSRKIVIIGIVAAVLLIALVIGLAVGLTVGR